MNELAILGWDVGGAHLKAALLAADGKVLRLVQEPYPLWRGLEQLQRAATNILQRLGDVTVLRHAVTMTGELADVFANRAEGVVKIAQAMTRIVGSQVRFYAGRSGFVDLAAVSEQAADIASANWHASATYVAAHLGDGVFVDIGSTTADFIPIISGQPAAYGYSDAERLKYDELVYTGVVRTPVMAVARQLPLAGAWLGTAAEHFATMADVYRLSGELPPQYDMADTADSRGKSVQDSARRLARMAGCDLENATLAQWRQFALAVRAQQLNLLEAALLRQLSRPALDAYAPLVGAGVGAFLVRELARRAGRDYLDAVQLLPHDSDSWAGVCFPAFAVAWLAVSQP